MSVCVCACVCACARAREGAARGQGERGARARVALLLSVSWSLNAPHTQKTLHAPLSLPPPAFPSSFRQYTEAYAKDKKAFNADFAAAFQKLEELGTSGLRSA